MFIYILAIIFLALLITVVFWKKTKLLVISPLATLLVIPVSFIPHDPCHSFSQGYYDLYSILSFLLGLYASSLLLSSLVFILGGLFLWIRNRKDKSKSWEAKKLIFAGFSGLILTLVIFITANVLVSALGLNYEALCIPKLQDFK